MVARLRISFQTRLRKERSFWSVVLLVPDRQVNEQAVKAAGATGIIRPGKNACQVIVDTNVKSVYDELDKLLK